MPPPLTHFQNTFAFLNPMAAYIEAAGSAGQASLPGAQALFSCLEKADTKGALFLRDSALEDIRGDLASPEDSRRLTGVRRLQLVLQMEGPSSVIMAPWKAFWSYGAPAEIRRTLSSEYENLRPLLPGEEGFLSPLTRFFDERRALKLAAKGDVQGLRYLAKDGDGAALQRLLDLIDPERKDGFLEKAETYHGTFYIRARHKEKASEIGQALVDIASDQGHAFGWAIVSRLFSLARFLTDTGPRSEDLSGVSVKLHGESLLDIASSNPGLAPLVVWGFLMSALTVSGDDNHLLLGRAYRTDTALDEDRRCAVRFLLQQRIERNIQQLDDPGDERLHIARFAELEPDLFSKISVERLIRIADKRLASAHRGYGCTDDHYFHNAPIIEAQDTLKILAEKKKDLRLVHDRTTKAWSIGGSVSRTVTLQSLEGAGRTVFLPAVDEERLTVTTGASGSQSLTIECRNGKWFAADVSGPFMIRPRPCDGERFLQIGEPIEDGTEVAVLFFGKFRLSGSSLAT